MEAKAIGPKEEDRNRLERLAASGNVTAMYTVAVMYASGMQGENRRKEALAWYRMAALQGDAKASEAVSDELRRICGNESALSRNWLILAGKQGGGGAQGRLSIKYYRGAGGFEQDRRLGYAWGLVAKQSDPSNPRAVNWLRQMEEEIDTESRYAATNLAVKIGQDIEQQTWRKTIRDLDQAAMSQQEFRTMAVRGIGVRE